MIVVKVIDRPTGRMAGYLPASIAGNPTWDPESTATFRCGAIAEAEEAINRHFPGALVREGECVSYGPGYRFKAMEL